MLGAMPAFEPIGVVRHDAPQVPRHYTVSDLEGDLVLDARFQPGLTHVTPGEHIVVLFHFDRSPPFTGAHLFQTPPTRSEPRGLFSICSPIRPNAIGLSILEVLAVDGRTVRVRGVDMLDGTPILDLKPFKPPLFPR